MNNPVHTKTFKSMRDRAAAKKALLDMLDELKKLPKPPSVQKREPIEFADRPGLY